MIVSVEILAQIEFLSESDTHWLDHSPLDAGEACAAYRVLSDGKLVKLSYEAMTWLDKHSPNPMGIVAWNDGEAMNKEQVIEVLTLAYELAVEQEKEDNL